MNQKVKGYILAAIAAATYGMNPLFALPLYKAGMSVDSVLLFRYLLALPIIAMMIIARGRSFRVSRGDLGVLAIVGVLMAVSSLALFMSYNYMDAGIASTMLFVYPIMVALIMVIGYKERLSMTTVLSIALALGGIVMLYKGDGDGGTSLSLIGTLLVMLSALSYAIYIVAVNQSRLSKVATLTVTFYVLLFGILLYVARVFMCGEFTVVPTDKWYLWGCVLALAVFPTAISFICTTSAIQYIGSTPTAILGALEPVTAVIIGITVFGERLTFTDVVGLVMIIIAVSAVIAAPSIHPSLNGIRRLFPRLRSKKR